MAPCALLVRCASTNSGLSDQPWGGVAGHVEALGAVVMQPPSTLGLAAAGDGYQRGLSGRYRRIKQLEGAIPAGFVWPMSAERDAIARWYSLNERLMRGTR